MGEVSTEWSSCCLPLGVRSSFANDRGLEVAKNDPTLVDLLAQLRRDIDTAQAELKKQGKAPVLNIDSVEAEIQYVVEKTKEGGLRLSIPFLGGAGGGGSLKRSDGATQSITIKLIPEGTIGIAGKR
jgi:hypothetical protein